MQKKVAKGDPLVYIEGGEEGEVIAGVGQHFSSYSPLAMSHLDGAPISDILQNTQIQANKYTKYKYLGF